MDTSLYRDINRLAVHTAWAHPMMKAIAVYAVGLFSVLLILAWWYARRAPNSPRAVAASVWTAGAVIVVLGLNQLIGSAIHRARPYATLSAVEVLVSRSHDPSFPSDHSVTAGAAAAGLWVVAHYCGKANRRIAVVGTVLALLVAFSRVYVGAHYPVDVIAGLALGAAVTLLGWLILNRPLTALAGGATRQRILRPLFVAGERPEHRTRTA